MAFAELRAILSLDRSQFGRSIDGATGQVRGFASALTTMQRGIALAFGIAAIRKFQSTIQDIREFTKDTGITVISEGQLQMLEKASSVLRETGIRIEAAGVSFVGHVITGMRSMTSTLGTLMGGGGLHGAYMAGEAELNKGNGPGAIPAALAALRRARVKREADAAMEVAKQAEKNAQDLAALKKKFFDQGVADEQRRIGQRKREEIDGLVEMMDRSNAIQDEAYERRKKKEEKLAELKADYFERISNMTTADRFGGNVDAYARIGAQIGAAFDPRLRIADKQLQVLEKTREINARTAAAVEAIQQAFEEGD